MRLFDEEGKRKMEESEVRREGKGRREEKKREKRAREASGEKVNTAWPGKPPYTTSAVPVQCTLAKYSTYIVYCTQYTVYIYIYNRSYIIYNIIPCVNVYTNEIIVNDQWALDPV